MRAAALIVCVSLIGCTEEPTGIDGSASMDGGGFDVAAPDGSGALAGVFTIVGCDRLDQSTVMPMCTVHAPAQLSFVPLAAGVTDFVWSFAGGSPSSSHAITPVSSWSQPGTFVVTLAAGGPAGTTVSSGQVIVTAGAVGDPCGAPADCDVGSGLSCVCGSGAVCPGGLSVGLCTRRCAPDACAAGELCVDLTRGFVDQGADAGVPDGGPDLDAWRRPLCLRSCTSNADCRVGLFCREVPSLGSGFGMTAGGAFTWKKACFADVLGDVGASCASASGAPAGDRCLSGRCDPLGARDLCTSDCAQAACPSYAGCAAFNATPAIHECLRRCDAQHPCTDPLLDCLPVGGAGSFGFTVMPPDPAGTTYCAPRRCTQPTDCAPAGTCTNGFCARS